MPAPPPTPASTPAHALTWMRQRLVLPPRSGLAAATAARCRFFMPCLSAASCFSAAGGQAGQQKGENGENGESRQVRLCGGCTKGARPACPCTPPAAQQHRPHLLRRRRARGRGCAPARGLPASAAPARSRRWLRPSPSHTAACAAEQGGERGRGQRAARHLASERAGLAALAPLAPLLGALTSS